MNKWIIILCFILITTISIGLLYGETGYFGNNIQKDSIVSITTIHNETLGENNVSRAENKIYVSVSTYGIQQTDFKNSNGIEVKTGYQKTTIEELVESYTFDLLFFIIIVGLAILYFYKKRSVGWLIITLLLFLLAYYVIAMEIVIGFYILALAIIYGIVNAGIFIVNVINKGKM